MNNVNRIVSKVRQAPWRVQRQWIGLFLLGVVLVTMVSALYLNVTVRIAVAGREIQMLEEDIATGERTNADLETELAGLTSAAAMQNRARALGFSPASPDEITYIYVAGYTPPSPVNLAETSGQVSETPILLSGYSETLFDWFTRKLTASIQTGGQP